MKKTDNTELQVRDIMAEFSLTDDDFSDEIDSLTFISLMIAIEDKFDIVIEDDKMIISEFANVGEITDYVNSRLADKEFGING